jgi:hypothetical protein
VTIAGLSFYAVAWQDVSVFIQYAKTHEVRAGFLRIVQNRLFEMLQCFKLQRVFFVCHDGKYYKPRSKLVAEICKNANDTTKMPALDFGREQAFILS